MGTRTISKITGLFQFCPVSLVFEKIAFIRMTSFIEKHNIINASQFGFRKGHSTIMPLLKFYDSVSNDIDNKKFSIGIFIDLKKAFDSLDHNILLSKLLHYGFRGPCHAWISDYLSSRSQSVFIDGTLSSSRLIKFGVPQGSILGPLLFILFINDIVSSSSILKFLLFADDTNLMYSHSNIETLFSTVNKELDKLATWFNLNRLSLNLNKTNYILFGYKRTRVPAHLSLTIDGTLILEVDHTKFLGIYTSILNFRGTFM